jgi:DNA-binding transcriptional MerR regulator
MRVTDIASRAGVGAHTVRYYVRAGLIAPGRDPSNNYKRFGEEDVVRLRFIKAVQALGFSLAEVQDMLSMVDQGKCPCASIHERLADKLLEAGAQMHALARRIEFMQRVYEGWSETSNDRQALRDLCRELELRAAANAPPAPPANPKKEKASGDAAGSRSATGKAALGSGARGRSTKSAKRPLRDETTRALSLLEASWPAARVD